MAYNFKNLADVELLNAMPEEANVLVEVNGTTKRAPQVASGPSGMPYWSVAAEEIDEEPYVKMTASLTHEELKDMVENGVPPMLVNRYAWEEDGERYIKASCYSVSYILSADGTIHFKADCEYAYEPNGTLAPVPI